MIRALFVLSFLLFGIFTGQTEDIDKLYIDSGGEIRYLEVGNSKVKFYTYPGKRVSNDTVQNFTIALDKKIENKILKKYNSKYLKSINTISVNTSQSSLTNILKDLLANTKIKYVQETPKKKVFVESIYFPNDQYYDRQWALDSIGFLEFRKFIQDNNFSSWGSPVIAVLDVGIYYDNPELQDRIYLNTEEVPGNNRDDDNNGYVDDYAGVDVGHPECSLAGCLDDYEAFHGTAMASIMGSETDNNYYMAGAAVDDVKVLPISASYDYENVDKYNEAYEYLLDMKERGVNIVSVNVSAGGPFDNTEYNLMRKLREADVLVIAAAGNESRTINNSSKQDPVYPAGYDLDNIISVGSYDQNNKISYFSNKGDLVDIFVPGEDILQYDYPDPNGSYVYGSGTSQAAALMSGIVGNAKYLYPGCSNLEIRNLILNASEILNNFKTIKLSSHNNSGLISDGKLRNVSCSMGIGNR